MITQPDLGVTERRIFRAYWQDGVLDLLAGVSAAVIGVGALFGVLVPMMGVPIVAVFAWQVARRRITEPRLGSVVFSERRVRQMRCGLIAIASLGLVVGGNLVTRVWVHRSESSFSEWFAPAIPAMIVAAMSMSCAAALGLWRFVVYGVIFALAGLGMAEGALEPGWALVGGGLVVAGWGVVMLVRFVHRHPALPAAME